MDLIIKPTQRCNFQCTFCSSTEISNSNSLSDDLDINKVKQFLKRFPETKTIIVNGGDPLLLAPEYYFSILEFIREFKMSTKLNLCTNLWGYYLHPEKWRELFSCPEVGIGTSYDLTGRMIGKNRPFTLNLFLTIMNKFKDEFYYYPSFISVISKENATRAFELVELAKSLNIECKLNYLNASGRSKENFSIGEIYNIYLDIYEANLTEFEFNTKQMVHNLKSTGHSICPQNRDCDKNIRNLQPMKDGHEYGSCGSFGDNRKFGINFEDEMNGAFYTPLRSEKKIQYLKEECFECPNFNICNGCYKAIYDLKESQKVEESCSLMKQFRVRAQELNLA